MILEAAILVQDIGDTAGHARCEIPSGLADNDNPSSGHVLAAVIAHALDDRTHAAIADSEAFTGHAPNIGLTAGCAVERYIADDDVFFRREGRAFGRIQDHFAAGESFPEIVVGIALEFQSHAGRNEGTKALAGGSLEVKMNRIFGKTLRSKAARHLA